MSRDPEPPTELPFMRWGDDHHARKMRRRQYRTLFAGGFAIGLIGASIVWPMPLRLVWNATASAPIGLYAVSDAGTLRVGDMVVVRLPEPARSFAASRHYLPANVPLIKRIAAGPGDEVCALGPIIFINGQPAVRRQVRDKRARKMPAWIGCQTLGQSQLFLLMRASPASFDGRYFGPLDRGAVLGKARAIWTR